MLKILILGDGNMSFALALEKLIAAKSPIAYSHLGLPINTDISLTATTFDSEAQLFEKYQESKEILKHMHSARLHEINAWELKKYFCNERFDVVCWNHPHLGTEDFRLHRFLLAHFFASVRDVLNPTGKVCISLVKGQHLRWNIVAEANRSGLNVCTMDDFDANSWPGYEVKRNKHGRSFKNVPTMIQHACEMKSLAFQFSFSPANPEIVALLEQERLESADAPNNCIRRQQAALVFSQSHTCPHCSRLLSSQRGLENHIHTVHTLQKFGSDWTHNGPKIHPCPNCPKLFRSKESAWQHTVNRHSTLDDGELLIGENGHQPTCDSEYDYVPCEICGQAVERREHGMTLHLETLKPAIGLNMQCPKCLDDSFIESRALFQHYKFCRLKFMKSGM